MFDIYKLGEEISFPSRKSDLEASSKALRMIPRVEPFTRV
jgi:hypothetical protein